MLWLRALLVAVVVVVVFATPAAAQKRKKKASQPAAEAVQPPSSPAESQEPTPPPEPPAPPPGPAVSPALDGDAAFTAGKQLYSDLEYEQAVFRFQEVALKTTLTPTDKGIVLTWLGLAYAGTGDLDTAKRAFVDAARNEKAVELPVETSPRIVELFAAAKQEAATLPPLVAEKPEPPPPPPPKEMGGTTIAAAVGTAAGGALVVAGVGLGVMCALSYGEATNRDQTQLDAKAALDTANLTLAGAGLLLPVGAAIGGASTYFLVTGD